MPKVNDSLKFIANQIGKPFVFIASLASIIGLAITIINDAHATIIALVTICSTVIFIGIYFAYLANRFINLGGEKIEVKSTFVEYIAEKNTIIYRNYKVIQAKYPFLTEYEWGFKWSGTHLPKITSDRQNVEHVIDEKNQNKYDRAILKFKKPLRYNETTVIHLQAICDDTDKKSRPYVESKVAYSIDIIHYRITLKDKPDNYAANAILERKNINSDTSSTFIEVKKIPFDTATKSYEYHLIDPEVGYFYRIRWT